MAVSGMGLPHLCGAISGMCQRDVVEENNRLKAKVAELETIESDFQREQFKHFAGLAMQGLLANSFNDGCHEPASIQTHEVIASESVLYAHALIKALETSDSTDETKV